MIQQGKVLQTATHTATRTATHTANPGHSPRYSYSPGHSHSPSHSVEHHEREIIGHINYPSIGQVSYSDYGYRDFICYGYANSEYPYGCISFLHIGHINFSRFIYIDLSKLEHIDISEFEYSGCPNLDRWMNADHNIHVSTLDRLKYVSDLMLHDRLCNDCGMVPYIDDVLFEVDNGNDLESYIDDAMDSYNKDTGNEIRWLRDRYDEIRNRPNKDRYVIDYLYWIRFYSDLYKLFNEDELNIYYINAMRSKGCLPMSYNMLIEMTYILTAFFLKLEDTYIDNEYDTSDFVNELGVEVYRRYYIRYYKN
jgi:hypothetical protein